MCFYVNIESQGESNFSNEVSYFKQSIRTQYNCVNEIGSKKCTSLVVSMERRVW